MRRQLTMFAVVCGKRESAEIDDLMRGFNGRMNGSSCDELEMQTCDERKVFEGGEQDLLTIDCGGTLRLLK